MQFLMPLLLTSIGFIFLSPSPSHLAKCISVSATRSWGDDKELWVSPFTLCSPNIAAIFLPEDMTFWLWVLWLMSKYGLKVGREAWLLGWGWGGNTLQLVLSFSGKEIHIDVKYTKPPNRIYWNKTLFRNLKHMGLGYVCGGPRNAGEITEAFCVLISLSIKWECCLSVDDTSDVTRTETRVAGVQIGNINGTPCWGGWGPPDPAWHHLPGWPLAHLSNLQEGAACAGSHLVR